MGLGFFPGKYTRADDGGAGLGEGRLDGKTPMFQKFTERNWGILEVLRGVSAELGRPMAEVGAGLGRGAARGDVGDPWGEQGGAADE